MEGHPAQKARVKMAGHISGAALGQNNNGKSFVSEVRWETGNGKTLSRAWAGKAQGAGMRLLIRVVCYIMAKTAKQAKAVKSCR